MLEEKRGGGRGGGGKHVEVSLPWRLWEWLSCRAQRQGEDCREIIYNNSELELKKRSFLCASSTKRPYTTNY